MSGALELALVVRPSKSGEEAGHSNSPENRPRQDAKKILPFNCTASHSRDAI